MLIYSRKISVNDNQSNYNSVYSGIQLALSIVSLVPTLPGTKEL
ncbi:hypothetical protein SAMN05421827_10418 [Pedobacter terrae]|uniref:Uncharacterized protein n=1 Tax=Pedobacter terrae TaxID=405671 RepID=A0A1G7S5B4_9SPHI|nr:hypothetical protein SAMN05421827_10418 [Pedobacter terrae]